MKHHDQAGAQHLNHKFDGIQADLHLDVNENTARDMAIEIEQETVRSDQEFPSRLHTSRQPAQESGIMEVHVLKQEEQTPAESTNLEHLPEQNDGIHNILAAGHAINAHHAEVPTALREEHIVEINNASMAQDIESEPAQGTSFDQPTDASTPLSGGGSDYPRIQAFAKLEFDDGQFYMNTYAVELGRDIRAARLVTHPDLDTEQEPQTKLHKRSTSSADAYHTPRKMRRDETRKLASSVSESGGIILDIHDIEASRKAKARYSKSTSSSSHKKSRRNSYPQMAQTEYHPLDIVPQSSMTHTAHPVNATSLLPSPDECPLIPIHPPVVPEGATAGHRGISRKHAKIAYNFGKQLFELEVMGRNGLFVDDEHCPRGQIVELKSGSYIQIGGVGFRFILPNVEVGETGAEDAMSGAMSFDFEDGRDGSIHSDDSGEMSPHSSRRGNLYDEQDWDSSQDGQRSEVEMSPAPEVSRPSNTVSEAAEDERAQPAKGAKKSSPTVARKDKPKPGKGKSKPQPTIEIPEMPVKRKGPGRPPKNGFMSKRELALIARAQKEAAKAESLKNGTPLKPFKSIPVKANATEQSQAPQTDAKPEKRKYTKRKKVEAQPETAQDVRETTEKTDSMPPEQMNIPPKPVKEKKAKPPRSPSPVFDESKLTEEQLAKPTQSYVVLIHEALSNSPTGAMSLPQIYRAIMRRYPYYSCRATTLGWQSSVRHNLSQHAAFCKIERDGKGWMWGLVPEVSIEKEKKRKPDTPPTAQGQQYYQHPQHYGPPHGYPGYPPPNGQIPNGYPHPMHHPGVPHLHSYSVPPHHITGPTGHQLPFLPPISAPNTTYQSPYNPPPESKPLLNTVPPPQSDVQQMTNPDPDGATALSPKNLKPAINAENSATVINSDTVLSPDPTSNPPPTSDTDRSTNISPDVLAAIGKFKTALINSMPDEPDAERIVTSAINRTLGTQSASSAPDGQEYPQEKTIMQALSSMLETLRSPKQTPEDPQRQTSHPPPQSQMALQAPPPPSFHPQYQPPALTNSLNSQYTQSQIRQIIEKIHASPTPAPSSNAPASENADRDLPPPSATPEHSHNALPKEAAMTNGEQQEPLTHGVKRSLEDVEEEHTSKKVAV